MENPKDSRKNPKVRSKVPKAQGNGETLKTDISSLENLKSETILEDKE